jgi:uncharacterized protein with HEPN domain/predicted nucleotidyltransferase
MVDNRDMQQVADTKPLRREEAMRILRAHEAELRAQGVTRLALFGSTVRDEARPDSDVDVLVDIDWQQPFSLIEWAGLELYLQDVLGRRVEVSLRRGLKRHLTNSIMADAEEVFPVLGRRALEPGGIGMPAHNLRQRLQDILDAIGELEDFTAGKTFEDVRATALLRRGIERDIEVISEASRRITADLIQKHPQVPWHKVMAIGNILRHEYEKVQAEILWSIVTKDLPVLRQAIEAMIATVEGKGGEDGAPREGG